MATVAGIPERISEIDEVRMREPMWSVKSRLSWGALLAGAVVAVAAYSLLSLLGVAVGVTVSDQFNAEQMGKAVSIWTFVTLLLAMFIGGWVSTRCTVGEFRSEAVLYGIIVWAVTSSVLIPLTALGIGAGVSTVLTSRGIAKLKAETIPPVVNAQRMAQDKLVDAKQELSSIRHQTGQTDDSTPERDGSVSSDRTTSSSTSAESDSADRSAADSKSTSDTVPARSDRSRNNSSKDQSRDNGNNTHQSREELKAASWWAFGGTFASLLAAIFGAIVGPTILVVRHKVPVRNAPVVVASPTV